MMFYMADILFCMATILQMSMLVEIPVCSKVFALARYASAGIAFLLVAYDFCFEDSCPRMLWKNIVIFWIAECSVISGDRTLLFAILLVMASVKTEFDQIVKCNFVVLAASFLITVLLSVVGVIPDLMFKRMDVASRHALGFNYPSTVMTCLFFLLLMYLWMRKRLSVIEAVLIIALDVFFFKLTDSRLGFLMIAGITILVFIGSRKVLRKFYKRHRKGVRSFWGFLAQWCGVAVLGLTVLLTVFYNTSVGQLADRILTKRITYIISGIQNFGIHLWANRISWIGFGGSTDTDSLLEAYNYVDNSYIKTLLDQGILVFILVMAMTVYIGRRVWKEYSSVESLLIICVMIYCFVEPRLMDLHVNVFLYLAAPFLCGRFLRAKARGNEVTKEKVA